MSMSIPPSNAFAAQAAVPPAGVQAFTAPPADATAPVGQALVAGLDSTTLGHMAQGIPEGLTAAQMDAAAAKAIQAKLERVYRLAQDPDSGMTPERYRHMMEGVWKDCAAHPGAFAQLPPAQRQSLMLTAMTDTGTSGQLMGKTLEGLKGNVAALNNFQAEVKLLTGQMTAAAQGEVSSQTLLASLVLGLGGMSACAAAGGAMAGPPGVLAGMVIGLGTTVLGIGASEAIEKNYEHAKNFEAYGNTLYDRAQTLKSL